MYTLCYSFSYFLQASVEAEAPAEAAPAADEAATGAEGEAAPAEEKKPSAAGITSRSCGLHAVIPKII